MSTKCPIGLLIFQPHYIQADPRDNFCDWWKWPITSSVRLRKQHMTLHRSFPLPLCPGSLYNEVESHKNVETPHVEERTPSRLHEWEINLGRAKPLIGATSYFSLILWRNSFLLLSFLVMWLLFESKLWTLLDGRHLCKKAEQISFQVIETSLGEDSSFRKRKQNAVTLWQLLERGSSEDTRYLPLNLSTPVPSHSGTWPVQVTLD